VDYDLNTLPACTRCPRLVALRQKTQRDYPGYHAAPVGSWGDPRAHLIIVGLAPGLHGAARTGRAFVGDASGEFLFAALHRLGFSSHDDPSQARLLGARITNVVKCLPPRNTPTGAELTACAGYLRAELAQYCPPGSRRPRVLVTLGGVAHRAVCKALDLTQLEFAHAKSHQISAKLSLISSFHPSRLNVNTRRLTAPMLDQVFVQARSLLV
jgi:uracil-DNA glycosylase family 4